jgi:hypothetical protein
MRAAATQLGMQRVEVDARVFGRWPDGVPLVDDAHYHPASQAGQDPCTNNDFLFRSKANQVECPLGAHIRKANPRDDEPGLVRQHRLLRRGISYGSAESREKGLLFLAYQASISNQFEYVARRMNQANPQASGNDIDLIAGENHGNQRTLTLPSGQVIVSNEPFVVATGGGYFFTPSIWALEKLAEGSREAWKPPLTNTVLGDQVRYAYYELGRFIYEQAPYATGPDLEISADFYHSASNPELAIKTDGLAKKFGLHPLKTGTENFFRASSAQLTDEDQMKCLWWYFKGKVTRVTKAIKIPYRYKRAGQDTQVGAELLIGFAGPGTD